MTVLRFLIFYIAICLANTAYAAPLRVALLLEHGDDSAWTGLLRKGLEQAAKKFDIDAEVLIFPPDESQRDNFRKAAETHDLVLVASDNLHEALRDNAANYRRVKFGSIDAGIRAPNIMSVTFADEQAAFLAGAASAMLASEKPVLGWLTRIARLYRRWQDLLMILGRLLPRPSGSLTMAPGSSCWLQAQATHLPGR